MAAAAVASSSLSRLSSCHVARSQRTHHSLPDATRCALPSFSGLKAGGALEQAKQRTAAVRPASARRSVRVAPQATLDPVRNPLYGRTHSSLWAKNQYTFEVDNRATKTDIRSFLESVFRVRVIKVNTWRLPDKKVRRGGTVGVKSRRKRATVRVVWNQRMRVYPDPRSYINE